MVALLVGHVVVVTKGLAGEAAATMAGCATLPTAFLFLAGCAKNGVLHDFRPFRQRGPAADVKLYEQTPLPKPLADKPRLGDKAYATPEIATPHKKPKGGPLTEEQKVENRRLSSQQVYVEHGIRRVKGFRITRDDYCLAIGLFPSVVSVVVGLLQFSQIVG